MVVCVPVTPSGGIDRWGRARRMAVARVEALACARGVLEDRAERLD